MRLSLLFKTDMMEVLDMVILKFLGVIWGNSPYIFIFGKTYTYFGKIIFSRNFAIETLETHRNTVASIGKFFSETAFLPSSIFIQKTL